MKKRVITSAILFLSTISAFTVGFSAYVITYPPTANYNISSIDIKTQGLQLVSNVNITKTLSYQKPGGSKILTNDIIEGNFEYRGFYESDYKGYTGVELNFAFPNWTNPSRPDTSSTNPYEPRLTFDGKITKTDVENFPQTRPFKFVNKSLSIKIPFGEPTNTTSPFFNFYFLYTTINEIGIEKNDKMYCYFSLDLDLIDEPDDYIEFSKLSNPNFDGITLNISLYK